MWSCMIREHVKLIPHSLLSPITLPSCLLTQYLYPGVTLFIIDSFPFNSLLIINASFLLPSLYLSPFLALPILSTPLSVSNSIQFPLNPSVSTPSTHKHKHTHATYRYIFLLPLFATRQIKSPHFRIPTTLNISWKESVCEKESLGFGERV